MHRMLHAIQNYLRERKIRRNQTKKVKDNAPKTDFLNMRKSDHGILRGEALYQIAKGIDTELRRQKDSSN